MMSSTISAPLRVLLTNDDGPPGPDSPYVYGLYRHLTCDLGWDVKVVIPSSQKSWIGKAYQIKDTINGSYYYPREPDGKGDISRTSRSLKDGEVAEWILLDGTPATCANIALYNIYPGAIDLVVSGPNLGRNSSSAFAMSSGTLGAALSSSLVLKRAIAVSYGTVTHPTSPLLFEPAHIVSGKIIRHLWNNWGNDVGGLRRDEVDLYSINLPMINGLLSVEGLPIYWTNIWRNSYGKLFKAQASDSMQTSAAGPDSMKDHQHMESESSLDWRTLEGPNSTNNLTFKFAPDFRDILRPEHLSIPEGTDAWALDQGYISVTPLRASIAEPPGPVVLNTEDAMWRVKL